MTDTMQERHCFHCNHDCHPDSFVGDKCKGCDAALSGSDETTFTREQFEAQHGNLEIILAVTDHDDSHYGEATTEYTTYKGGEIYDLVAELRDGEDLDANWHADFASIRHTILDSGSFDYVSAGVLTPAEYEQRLLDKARRKYEPLASDIARRYDVKPATIDFCRALDKAIEDAEQSESHQRYGMREDGLCASGGSVDGWFDEFNSIGSVSADLRGLRDWFETECPMLWAKYQESIANTAEVVEL